MFMYTYALDTVFYACFSDLNLSIYMIYCRSFNFLYVTCYCLYLHAWTTSLDHIHVCLLCMSFGFIKCTRWGSNNLGSSCPDPRAWTMVALL